MLLLAIFEDGINREQISKEITVDKIIKFLQNEIKLEKRWNQIFHYTSGITPKRVTSLRGPTSRHCSRATQLISKKFCSGSKPSATLCLIWSARDWTSTTCTRDKRVTAWSTGPWKLLVNCGINRLSKQNCRLIMCAQIMLPVLVIIAACCAEKNVTNL